MVSVVIPTFNRSRYLREAVESVLSQAGVDEVELIVVDDGSTDDTAAAMKAYADRLRYVGKAHGGVSSARNEGIRHAKGEWLAFLDSDDFWLPGKLAAQWDFLRHHPHMKICQTEEIWMRNGRRLNPKKYHEKPQGHCFSMLLERCLVSPSAVMMHGDLLKDVGDFDESLPACEDYDLWLRVGCRYPIGLVEGPLVVKRGGHPDQLSATVESLDRYRILAIAKLLRAEVLDGDQRKAAFEALRLKCRIYGQGCLKRGKQEEAESILSLPERLAAELGLVQFVGWVEAHLYAP
jgi:glycosyltransferase involved in cell wall biosynthesis